MHSARLELTGLQIAFSGIKLHFSSVALIPLLSEDSEKSSSTENSALEKA